jgi:hypothetical protein
MNALAWLVMTSLVVLLIIDKLGGYLEVLKFLVVRCRIVKRLLLIRAQNKAVDLLGFMQTLQLSLLLEESFSLLFSEVFLVVRVTTEGDLVVGVLGMLLMEDIFLAIGPVRIVLGVY